MTACGHLYIHQKSIKNFGLRSLQVEIIGDSVQSGCVLLDVVHLCDLRGAVFSPAGSVVAGYAPLAHSNQAGLLLGVVSGILSCRLPVLRRSSAGLRKCREDYIACFNKNSIS